jgi:hypothetical protein
LRKSGLTCGTRNNPRIHCECKQEQTKLPTLRQARRRPRRDHTGNLDLISCRNLLIYLKTPLQDRLLRIFHEALHPGSLLFMGQSESLSFVGNSLFATVDYLHRLFRRRERNGQNARDRRNQE